MMKYQIGKIYTLSNFRDGSESDFEWAGKSWSTPGTGWGTKPGMMSSLGWHEPKLKEASNGN